MYTAVLTRRKHRHRNRTLIFRYSPFLIHSTHRLDAIGARYKPSNQAMSLDRDSVKAWEPISDQRIHVFRNDGDQASSWLDVTVWDRLHFKTDQLWNLPVICGDNCKGQLETLLDFCFFSLSVRLGHRLQH